MDGSLLLSLGEGLVVERVEYEATTLTVSVTSTSPATRCPLCQQPSDHLHSHYQRVVADLPCGEWQVRLRVWVPKLRCMTPTCPRQVFAERLAPLIKPWAHQTTRLKKKAPLWPTWDFLAALGAAGAGSVLFALLQGFIQTTLK
jgi:transposase